VLERVGEGGAEPRDILSENSPRKRAGIDI